MSNLSINDQLKSWVRIAFLNLLIVSLLGIILRYKIVFSLPFVDQKKLLHGHSHFAFTGWISHAIMCMMIAYVSHTEQRIRKIYRWLVVANLVTAYGMLISFPIQGYGPFSIVLSTLNIFVSYAFAIVYWRHLNQMPASSIHKWFKAALLFNVISSVAIFTLAAIMASQVTEEHAYMAAVYGFLHFQYNGWFMFGCFGLLAHLIQRRLQLQIPAVVFWLFALSVVPAYLLSVLWLQLPAWLYAIAVATVLAQVAALVYFFIFVKRNKERFTSIPHFTRNLLLLVAIAFTVKIILQFVSVMPGISTMVFAYRPIVIGYLHLVLLGIISLFLLAYFVCEQYMEVNIATIRAAWIFIGGVIANEVVLMTQGLFDIFFSALQSATFLLFIAAIIMATGLLLLNISQQKLRN